MNRPLTFMLGCLLAYASLPISAHVAEPENEAIDIAEGIWLENSNGYGMCIDHKNSDKFVRRNTIIGNRLGGVYWRAGDRADGRAPHHDPLT